MTYVETLYGHQAGVSAIDCHRGERPISVGRDRTARGWKLAEDTHLIFRGGSKVSSADCISCVKDDWFVSGHDDGHLCMWLTEKKKSVVTIPNAHGNDGKIGRGIVSVASLKGSDMVASGSNDGYLRLWKVRLQLLFKTLHTLHWKLIVLTSYWYFTAHDWRHCQVTWYGSNGPNSIAWLY